MNCERTWTVKITNLPTYPITNLFPVVTFFFSHLFCEKKLILPMHVSNEMAEALEDPDPVPVESDNRTPRH